MPPAAVRLQDYRHKNLNKQYQQAVQDEQRPLSMASNADATTQAHSFYEDEGATYNHPYKNFYTDNEPVRYTTVNKVEGRSNFYSYYPSDEVNEQKWEKYWYEAQNREVAEKRRDEENFTFYIYRY